MNNKRKPMIPLWSKLMYGSGSLGYSIVQQTANGLIMFFGTVAHGMPPILMGLATSIGMMWDAVTDPMVGYMSDKTDSKMFGRRHGFLIVATFMVAVLNILLWSLPTSFSTVAKFFWFMFGIMLLETFNTFFQTPYHALGVELSGDYYERSVIQAFKTVFMLIGMVVPTVLMGVMISSKENVAQYQNMSYISSIIMLVCGTLTVIGTYAQLPRLRAKAMAGTDKKKTGIFKQFFSTLKIKNFRSLVLGYAVSLMSAAFITSVGLHFFQYTFKFEFSGVAVLLGSLFVTTILSQPAWMALSRKMDKKPALLLGLAVEILGVIYLAIVFILYQYAHIVPSQPLFLLLPALMIIGFGVGAMFSLPTSMLGDLIAVEQARTKTGKTGVYNAFLTFSYKISQSLTIFIVGLMLQLIRFNADLPVQTPFVQGGLGWIIIVGVLMALVGGIVLYSGYKIKRSDVPPGEEPSNMENDAGGEG